LTPQCASADRGGCNACREDAAAEKRSLQRAQAMHSTAAEARSLSHRIETRDRLAGRTKHPALQVGLYPAEALAADDEFTNRDQRQCLCVVDLLEFAEPDAVAAISAQCGDATQLLVVHQLLAARDGRIVAADRILHRLEL